MATPKFERADIVNVQTPHTDGRTSSLHPALIVGDPLCNSHGDYVLVQITSTLYHGATDFIIRATDPEFAATGLTHDCTIRCHKIFPLTEFAVRRKRGVAGPAIMVEVEARLRKLLSL